MRIDDILKATFAPGSSLVEKELLLSHILSMSRTQLHINGNKQLAQKHIEQFESMLARLQKGEPLAYILGRKPFWKNDFIVGPGVLIPRPETEHIVETVLEEVPDIEEAYSVLDIGCGSGCIGLSLLAELPHAKLTGIDIARPAIAVSSQNAEALCLDQRSVFEHLGVRDYFEQHPGTRFDIIVSNPPYIAPDDPEVQDSVRKFEPHLALFAKNEGLEYIFEWSKLSLKHLNPGGLCLFEIGYGQWQKVQEYLSKLDFLTGLRVIEDHAGIERTVCFRRQRK